jgi:hypothetical protein
LPAGQVTVLHLQGSSTLFCVMPSVLVHGLMTVVVSEIKVAPTKPPDSLPHTFTFSVRVSSAATSDVTTDCVVVVVVVVHLWPLFVKLVSQ